VTLLPAVRVYRSSPNIFSSGDGGTGAGFGAGFVFLFAFSPFFLRAGAPRFAFFDFFATSNLPIGLIKIMSTRHHPATGLS
jgi:hypothetical protein